MEILDYSRKLEEEKKKQRKIFILIASFITIFAFSIGFYASYVFNDNNKANIGTDKLSTIYSILSEDWYYGKYDDNIEKTLIDNAIYGMLDEEIDPHTRYLTSLGSLANSYHGLGITVSEYKEYFVVTEIASKVNIDSGLRSGDILLSIDGNSLENKDSAYIKTLIENKESVSIVVQRGEETLTVIGYVTTYTPVTVFKDFSLSQESAYIQITEFANDTATYLNDYLSEAKNLGYNKLIIDLRDNPGGYITSVVDCADLFMEKDKVVLTTKDKHDNSYSYKTVSNDKYDFNKITILINNNSASGAEALSAALNENMGDIVELVGVTTYGKGSAQKMIYFTDGTYFNYTYALWFTPNDKTINKVGVNPEIVYTGSGTHLLDTVVVNLEKTNYGKDVYNLQVIMKELNYYDGELTSYYDESLEKAVKQYQIDCGFEESKQTGKLDDLTIRYLLADRYNDKVKDYTHELQSVIE